MDRIQIYTGDCRDVLPTLEAGSVQCVVTSPPYWGLRDYGTATWEGGDLACDHLGPPKPTQAGFNERYFGRPSTGADKQSETRKPFGATCGKCGARRIDSQIGLEPTPEAYVEQMVAVFREVRRVLRDDGTVWCNLGDSYAANRAYQVPDSKWTDVGNARGMKAAAFGLKPKDLVGIPWRVAFALQADGWYLRSDVIWAKPNPMPESVTDRPTKAHEYLFLLTKSQRYAYDAAAISELGDPNSANKQRPPTSGAALRASQGDRTRTTPVGRTCGLSPSGRRNRRSVWTITTQPYPGAHFAVMPEALVEPCVKAGSRPGDLVLDPFAGAGTVGVVAKRYDRQFVGVELNPAYVALAEQRIAAESDRPLLADPYAIQPNDERQGALFDAESL